MTGAVMHDRALATAKLLADGYVILPDLVCAETLAAVAAELGPRFASTPFCKGGFYGARTKRFGALLRRSQAVRQLVAHPVILEIIDTVLGAYCDRFALSLSQAIEIHPGALAQIPHRDQDIYGGTKGTLEYQINVIWPLTPFTAANGATLIWPGSHGASALSDAGPGEPIAAEMSPGSALLWLGSTLHGAGANLADAPRRAVIAAYCLGWLKPFENQWLVYPPEIARSFDPELRALIGYAQHRPNLGNVEGQCPSVLFERGSIDGLAAVDALRPDQAVALTDYVAEQEAARAGIIGG
jgi:ectoine hydroxylase-related dioxygenase (phytanoyl-CoA dioxygenase family)